MFFIYRKILNIFPENNHDQHDVMDHNYNHETTTGFIKIDNPTIFTHEFAKKPTQIYDAMVNVLKQLKNIRRVNEILKNEFNERKNHGEKNYPSFFHFSTNI